MSKFTRCGHDRLEWEDLCHFPFNIIIPITAIAIGLTIGAVT